MNALPHCGVLAPLQAPGQPFEGRGDVELYHAKVITWGEAEHFLLANTFGGAANKTTQELLSFTSSEDRANSDPRFTIHDSRLKLRTC
jgi:hypothetical protein